MVVAFVLLSEFTKAWLLYLGLVFLVMVMFAPGGIASLIMMNVRVARYGKLKGLLGGYAALLTTGLLAFLGLSAMVEMVYHLQLNEALGPVMNFMGLALDAKAPLSWVGAALLALIGSVAFVVVRRRFAHRWGEVQGEIEAAIRAKETAL
jgi:branched-chain amino acid transport system permease protein